MKSFFFFLFILLLVLNVSGFTSLGAPGGLLPNTTLASGVLQNDTANGKWKILNEINITNQRLYIFNDFNDKIIIGGTQADPHTILLGNSNGIRWFSQVEGNTLFSIAANADTTSNGTSTADNFCYSNGTRCGFNTTLASGVVQNNTIEQINITKLRTSDLTIDTIDVTAGGLIGITAIRFGNGQGILQNWLNCTGGSVLCQFAFGGLEIYTTVQPSPVVSAVIWSILPQDLVFWWSNDMLPNGDNIHSLGTNTRAWKNVTAWNYTFGGRTDAAFYLDNSTARNGTVVLTANFEARGNITSDNVFVPVYLFTHTNATVPVTGANEWTNMTFPLDFVGEVNDDIKFGILHTRTDNQNHTFTVLFDGVYDIDYDLDVINTGPPGAIDVAARVIYDNGTEIHGSVFEENIANQNAEVELTHDFLVQLKKDETIVLQFISDDADTEISTHGTFGDQPVSGSIRIFKIAN